MRRLLGSGGGHWPCVGGALLLFLLSSCGGGGGGGGSGLSSDEFLVVGQVLDESGDPLYRVPVSSTEASVLTTVDGFFRVTVRSGEEVLNVGDGLKQTVLRVKIEVDTPGGVAARDLGGRELFLDRPLFLVALENGFAFDVPAGVQATAIVLEDPRFPGFALGIEDGTLVDYSGPSSGEVLVNPYSAQRLPLPFPDRQWTRLGVEIGPLGLRVDRFMALELPNTEGLAAGEEADLLELDPDTGLWNLIGVMTSDGAGSLTGGLIVRGGLYVAVPRRVLDATTIFGVVLGTANQPVGDYRVLASTGNSTLSAEDGTFEIPDVPVYPDTLVRMETSSPPSFVPQFDVFDPVSVVLDPDPAASRTDVGILSVRSVLRIDVPPTMSFSPDNGSSGVSELTRMSVAFNRSIVASTTGFKLVRGVSREQGAIDGTLSWNADLTSFTFFPFDPLRNGSTYSFYVDKTTQDIEGNRVLEREAFTRFDVRESAADPGDSVRVRTFSTAFGVVGDQVLIRGANFGAASEVTFGDVEAFLQLRTTTEIVALVPEAISGQVPVKVQGTGDLPFRALPLFNDLTAGATGPEGMPRIVEGLGTHLGASPTIIYSSVRGGSFAAGDTQFEITLPAGVAAGYLRMEVDGFPTLSFFVRSDRAVP